MAHNPERALSHGEPKTMQISQHALFPTRLVELQFDGVEETNRELYEFFISAERFRDGFDMHPDSLNLLAMADVCPAIARLRGLFLRGLREWLRAERVGGELAADVVLFSNFAQRGDFTAVHNHNADLVGIYYVRTAEYERSGVVVPDPEGEYDYFAAEDGALLLHDPRFNANLAAVRARDYVKVFPRPGLMLIFPGYVWHSVTPHLGDFRRLALSANFVLRWPETRPAETWPIGLDAEVASAGPPT
jgi:hypothetical protein